mgnify:CR=1 FL=1
MAKIEECIITNMVMIYDNCGNVLVQDKIKPDWSGITFPGGHVEPGESFVKSAIREVKEETGLDVKNLKLCGLKQFTHLNDGYRYIVIYFKTNDFSGEIKSSSEGEVFWIKRSELLTQKCVSDFDQILKVFEEESLNENYYYYDNGWHLENL